MPRNRSKDPYTDLCILLKNTAVLRSIYRVLEWDQETYMPEEAVHIRSLQIEKLSSLIHQSEISTKVEKILSQLIDLNSGEVIASHLAPDQVSVVKEVRKSFLKEKKLPHAFVKKYANLTSNALHTWALAKRQNDFQLFSPVLEKIVSLNRKKADLLGYKEHPYDALLDIYEPEMTCSQLSPLFERLKIALKDILDRILTKSFPKKEFLSASFSLDKQYQFGLFLLKEMGFSEKTSRLDTSIHPFCSGIHPSDTRMATRIYLHNLSSSIFSVLHEGGHGLYHMKLPSAHFGSPLGEAISLGIDESQSRWWEKWIGHSLAFWHYFFPFLQKEFPEQLKDVSTNDFYHAINKVTPSFIRTEADEVTYSLHVILRFELEKALIEGSLKVKEIPEAWNEKMQKYLGIVPTKNSEGCLQDIHWAMGSIGYFPTYTLGNLYAAQFFVCFEQAYPDWEAKVREGNLEFISSWFQENLYQYGKRYTAEETVLRITKKPLSEEAFLFYLKKKYASLYSF